MNNNPLLKYLIRDKKEDVVHSSGYAKAQNGASMGAASTESFTKRAEVDRNRTMVRRYADARVMNDMGRNAWKARTNDASKVAGGAGDKVGIGKVVNGKVDGIANVGVSRAGGAKPPAQRRNPGIVR